MRTRFEFFKTALTVSLVSILLNGCSEYAERKIRSAFDVPVYQSLTVENIQNAAIKKIPIGSSDEEIYDYMKLQGFGADPLTSCSPVNESGKIVCRIEYDPDEFGFFVKKHYGIVFQLDSDRMLKEILIHEWVTGL